MEVEQVLQPPAPPTVTVDDAMEEVVGEEAKSDRSISMQGH
jgi:hypothetical protein